MPVEARIGLRHEGAVAVLSVDHPPQNALTQGMIRQVGALVAALEQDDAVRAVVLSGVGGKTFCGGLDAEEWGALSARDAQAALQTGFESFWALEHLTKPTIAAVEGACRGAGAQLALACDLRFASSSAVFSFPEADEAWMPSHGGIARLPRMVGRAKALEVLVTGAELPARTAAKLGFVERVVPRGKALSTAVRTAAEMARKPRTSVRAIKRALTEAEEKPYRNRFLLEAQYSVQLLWTEAYREAHARARRKES